MTKFVSIISGNGGVGKTTIAVNLALALNHLGRDVTLVDANLYTPHLNFHLGFPHLSANLHDFLEKRSKLEECTYLHPSGIKLIPGSLSFRKIDDRYLTNMKGVFEGLIGKSEIVLFDCAPGMNECVSLLVRNSDETITVLNQYLPSILDCKKIIAHAEDLGGSIIGCILNNYKREAKPTYEKISEAIHRPILAAVPNDTHISRAIEARNPVFLNEPRAPSSVEFEKLANLLNYETA